MAFEKEKKYAARNRTQVSGAARCLEADGTRRPLQAGLSLKRQGAVVRVRIAGERGGKTWEIDVFHGDNAGLVVAEVEIASESEQIEPPPWLGREVSNDPSYFNSNLVNNPYKNWRTLGD